MGRSVAIIGTRGYPSFYGGFETAIRHIAPYLAEHGWDVTVYGRPGSTKPDDQDVDQRVRQVETWGLSSKSLSTLSYGMSASLHASRRKPDVALVMNVANGYFLPILKARGIPTAVNVDGIEWERAKWGRTAKAVFKLGARLTSRFASELIYDSHEIGRRWERDFGRTGHFIPYGGSSALDLDVPAGLGHRQYALMVARFVPENSVPEFFEAAASLSKKWPVVIVGSTGYGGELDERALRLAESSDNVTWLGHVNNDQLLHSLWQHAGAYFHGHTVGGTNPALVQAMALGAPTVARDTPYNREVLGPNGTFVSENPTDILHEMDQLLLSSSRQESTSRDAISRARSQYTWPIVMEGYMAVLEELATRAMSRGDE
jgi:glycosyltransferase involved in cell wall biosynthesis